MSSVEVNVNKAVIRNAPECASSKGRPFSFVGIQLGQLDVRGAAVKRAEDVGRAPVVVVAAGSDYYGVAFDRHGPAEVVVARGVAGSQLGQLDVRGAAVKRAEDIGRTSSAVLVVGPDHDGVAVDGHGDAKVVAPIGVGGRQLRHFEVV